MFLSQLRIENFRIFGEGEQSLTIPFGPGLTALVGENDSGKTSIIDALRLVLGTHDQEALRVVDDDFHQPKGENQRRHEIRLRCKFEGLTEHDLAAFVEYITYESDANDPALYVNWKTSFIQKIVGQRRFRSVEVKSGKDGTGPQIDSEARLLLCAAYLRPLRDAERVMAAGRGSRLSQILLHTKEVAGGGIDYNELAEGAHSSPHSLNVVGIGDYTNDLLSQHPGVKEAQRRLNSDYLQQLSFPDDLLCGTISVTGTKGDQQTRLRQLLEKLELELKDESTPDVPSARGLGSNNLMFMACELLLLKSEEDTMPLLLIEEPEAHLHPQRQLRLMRFLQDKANETRVDGQSIQVIVTTHSPNLASAINLENLVLVTGGKAYSLTKDRTELSNEDYGFLQRFLDVTKSNLFFARGVLVVEGDAENILLPTLAELIGRDLTSHGVSIVNVGGTGLRRFARIFQRRNVANEGTIRIPIACITDLDVMPDCAPEILDIVEAGKHWPEKNKRKWRAKQDYSEVELAEKRTNAHNKASGQNVETFVADQWTLEYDLAYYGLAWEVWVAAHLAIADGAISDGKKSILPIVRKALKSFREIRAQATSQEHLSSLVYTKFVKGTRASKAIAAQYLAEILKQKRGLSFEKWRERIPPYIVASICYVTKADMSTVVGPQQVDISEKVQSSV